MLKINDFKGIIPPIVTPVTKDEEVNFEELGKVIDYVIDGGVHGVFPLGSNGEFYAHDFETQKQIIEFTVKHVNKRVPVYAGATHITTKGTIILAKAAEEAGADALSVLSPMFINPNEQEMYDHFADIANATNLPVVLYNNPGKTGNDISISLLKKLAKIKNIIGIKNTSPNFAQTIQYIEAAKEIEDFEILSGVDYYIFSTLCHGGVGAVAGTANVAPKLVVEIYEKYKSGDINGAVEAQKKLVPLRDAFNSGTFPVVAKDCLRLMGIISGTAVKPVTSCSSDKINNLKTVLKNLNLI
jgi:4-hydroxy-tetrahydrodipicolinate synthase